MEGTFDRVFGSNGSSFISGLDEYVDVEKDFDRVLSKLFYRCIGDTTDYVITESGANFGIACLYLDKLFIGDIACVCEFGTGKKGCKLKINLTLTIPGYVYKTVTAIGIDRDDSMVFDDVEKKAAIVHNFLNSATRNMRKDGKGCQDKWRNEDGSFKEDWVYGRGVKPEVHLVNDSRTVLENLYKQFLEDTGREDYDDNPTNVIDGYKKAKIIESENLKERKELEGRVQKLEESKGSKTNKGENSKETGKVGQGSKVEKESEGKTGSETGKETTESPKSQDSQNKNISPKSTDPGLSDEDREILAAYEKIIREKKEKKAASEEFEDKLSDEMPILGVDDTEDTEGLLFSDEDDEINIDLTALDRDDEVVLNVTVGDEEEDESEEDTEIKEAKPHEESSESEESDETESIVTFKRPTKSAKRLRKEEARAAWAKEKNKKKYKKKEVVEHSQEEDVKPDRKYSQSWGNIKKDEDGSISVVYDRDIVEYMLFLGTACKDIASVSVKQYGDSFAYTSMGRQLLIQARNLASFYKLAVTKVIKVENKDIKYMKYCLMTMAEHIDISDFWDGVVDCGKSAEGTKKSKDFLRLVDGYLREMGCIISMNISESKTTNSIYAILDNRQLMDICISDHESDQSTTETRVVLGSDYSNYETKKNFIGSDIAVCYVADKDFNYMAKRVANHIKEERDARVEALSWDEYQKRKNSSNRYSAR